jgi:hypothetical protein
VPALKYVVALREASLHFSLGFLSVGHNDCYLGKHALMVPTKHSKDVYHEGYTRASHSWDQSSSLNCSCTALAGKTCLLLSSK